MNNNALKISENDNVAIAMRNIKQGETVVIDGRQMFDAIEDIEAGHKRPADQREIGRIGLRRNRRTELFAFSDTVEVNTDGVSWI